VYDLEGDLVHEEVAAVAFGEIRNLKRGADGVGYMIFNVLLNLKSNLHRAKYSSK
jgi:hypothetical protein